MNQTFLNHLHGQSTSQANPGFEKHPGLAAPRGKKKQNFLILFRGTRSTSYSGHRYLLLPAPQGRRVA